MTTVLSFFDQTTMERNNTMSQALRALLRITCALLTLIGTGVDKALAQSSNTCGAANLFTVGTSCSYSNFDVASTYSATYNPGTCNSGNFDDGWGRFVATNTTTTVTFDPDDNHRPVLHVFTGTCTSSLTQVACVDAGSSGTNASVTFTTVVGTTYYFRVQRQASNSTMDGRICVWSPPPNDEPCTAIALPVNTTCTNTLGYNSGATATASNPATGCGQYSGGDVWYSFVAPANGAITIRMAAGTLTNGAMAVYAAPSCSGTMTLIECDDSDGPGNMPFLTFSGNDLVPGNTYYLRVWGNNNAQGNFNLCLQTAPATGSCFYILRLFDLVGNGWGGSTLAISVGGAPAVNYTLANGDQEVFYIPITTGQLIQASYTAAGGFQSEISYFVQLGDGVVFADGPTPATGAVQAYFATCAPPSPPPSDCSGGITVCGDQALNANPNNTGVRADLNIDNRGCLLNDERQGFWYHFRPSASGTIAFTISPSNPSNDYDFAIWGPFGSVQCPPPAAPLRCNYSGTAGNTGLSTSATSNSQGATGSVWSNAINVTAGQVFILYISNWSRSGLAFDLSWQLTNGASLDCTVLPVELLTFQGQAAGNMVELTWTTASESGTSHFAVERLAADGTFDPIGAVAALGESTTTTHYTLVDPSPLPGANHYRLRVVDSDGSSTNSDVVEVLVGRTTTTLTVYPNPTTGDLNMRVNVVREGTHTVRILDASGRILVDQQLAFTPGEQSYRTSLAQLAAAPYTILVLGPDGVPLHNGRFIKH